MTKFIQSIVLSIYFVIIEYTTTLFQTVFIFQIKIMQEKVSKHVFPKSQNFQIRLHVNSFIVIN